MTLSEKTESTGTTVEAISSSAYLEILIPCVTFAVSLLSTSMRKDEWKTWVQWYEVTGSDRGTIEEFRELLKKYNRSSLLIMCAQVSVAFAYGPEAETTASDELTKLWTAFSLPEIPPWREITTTRFLIVLLLVATQPAPFYPE